MITPENFCNVNVSGTNFLFSRSTLDLPHMKQDPFSNFASGKHNNKPCVFDVDPKVFEKWCAPYIRHELIPKSKDFSSDFDKEHLIRTANTIGLLSLAKLVKNLPDEQKLKEVRISYVTATPGPYINVTKHCVVTFNGMISPKGFTEIQCPDSACNAIIYLGNSFKEHDLSSFFLHFMASPHNGEKKEFKSCKNPFDSQYTNNYGTINFTVANLHKQSNHHVKDSFDFIKNVSESED